MDRIPRPSARELHLHDILCKAKLQTNNEICYNHFILCTDVTTVHAQSVKLENCVHIYDCFCGGRPGFLQWQQSRKREHSNPSVALCDTLSS